MRTPIILLNGTPSAGKTTLARALSRTVQVPAFYLSLDEFRLGIPERWWRTQDDSALFAKMVRAYLTVLDAVASEGIPVIAEAMLLPPVKALYQSLFDHHDVRLVGVRCPLEVAQARELTRGDRVHGPLDLDVTEFELVHAHRYDLEIDTSREETDVSVTRLLRLFASTTSAGRTRPAPTGPGERA